MAGAFTAMLSACQERAAGPSSHSHAAHEASGTARAPGTYGVDWRLSPAPVAGQRFTLTYVPQDSAGQPVARLDSVHERLSHLIIVSRDLATFEHTHAERLPDGTFSLPYTFGEAGPHVLFADFTPTGATAQLVRHEVTVAGEAPARRPLGAPTETAEDRGLMGHLALPARGLKAGQSATLTFHLMDATGAVSDLEQYLGAGGHVVVISEDSERFLHVHPEEPGAEGAAHDHHSGSGHAGHGATEAAAAPGRYGPELRFATTFSAAGRYKVWLQVQRRGVLYTLPFIVQVSG